MHNFYLFLKFIHLFFKSSEGIVLKKYVKKERNNEHWILTSIILWQPVHFFWSSFSHRLLNGFDHLNGFDYLHARSSHVVVPTVQVLHRLLVVFVVCVEKKATKNTCLANLARSQDHHSMSLVCVGHVCTLPGGAGRCLRLKVGSPPRPRLQQRQWQVKRSKTRGQKGVGTPGAFAWHPRLDANVPELSTVWRSHSKSATFFFKSQTFSG